MVDIVINPTYSQFTLEYAKLRNQGLANHSDISLYNYSSVNLSYPQGWGTQEEDLKPVSRLGKALDIHDYFKND